MSTSPFWSIYFLLSRFYEKPFRESALVCYTFISCNPPPVAFYLHLFLLVWGGEHRSNTEILKMYYVNTGKYSLRSTLSKNKNKEVVFQEKQTGYILYELNITKTKKKSNKLFKNLLPDYNLRVQNSLKIAILLNGLRLF